MSKFAIVNTKSNFRNLNGKRLKVVEEFSSFICCEFFSEGRILRADFANSEVVKIYQPELITDHIRQA
jgi:hypothetical protein